ncbi:acyl-CoA dehydrogenase [Streptomyces mashuensis]|uniref:Acyl-CoA dehydrogenase n=1 Tax=Streptomyces mashuensis TaxID=33904 RepID=A0A919B8D3_9ACTN|nr:acyl-CoA dehydrogenase family protein [Streptomyces mashuensis]GHF71105.1 acyl-CoA dehydrogenase [Streptomyces mashuensis]
MTTDTKGKDLTERAAALVGLLRGNAARTEEGRRVVEENIEALAGAGLFALTVPGRFGGHQASVRALLEVSAELGRGCGSTAWTTALVNVCAWITALYPERAQREVFGEDPGARVCSVFTPGGTSRAAGSGQVISGRWPFASGCLHAQWALLGTPVTGAAGEQLDRGVALVPMAELAVEDTWHTVGMRGTGSHTLVAEDVFVPGHRILSVSRALRGEYPTEFTDEALYRAPFVPVLASVLVGPQWGMARGGLELVTASLAEGRPLSHTFFTRAREASSTQMQLAEAAQLVDTAGLHLMRAADDIDACAASGRRMPLRERARVRMDTATVARRSREALDILLNLHGAGSFTEANPLQRLWRDQETASRHAMTNPAVASELYGRALLGIEEQVTPLI